MTTQRTSAAFYSFLMRLTGVEPTPIYWGEMDSLIMRLKGSSE